MMKNISIGAGLSQMYTNHCVRGSAIKIWSDNDIRHIMNISGRANEQSIASYNRRPSTSQLEKCSDVLSNVLLSGENTQRKPIALISNEESAITSSAVVQVHSRSMAINSIPNKVFSGCTIATANVFVLPK